jgi:hypothetical protein
MQRFVLFIKSGDKFSVKALWRSVILGREASRNGSGPEYVSLISRELEDYEQMELSPVQKQSDQQPWLDRPVSPHDTHRWSTDVRRALHRPSQSASSDVTVFDLQSPTSKHSDDTLNEIDHEVEKARVTTSVAMRLCRITFTASEYALVLAGFGQILTGIVVYTGGCRQNYINGCMAHLIST